MKEESHDFEAAQKASVEEREEAIENARSKITTEEQEKFEKRFGECTRGS